MRARTNGQHPSFAIVAGGGTAGHVLPALTVARAIAERHGPGTVELVGSRRGLDAKILSGAGMPVTLLPGRGFSRKLGVRPLISNLGGVVELALSFVMSLVLVVRSRPAVVVATGGYACVSTAVTARMLGVPVVLVNVDAVPGAANRLVARFAVACAVAFEGTDLPRATVTGAPVREEVLEAADASDSERAKARAELGLPTGRRVVGAFGGSLGAERINNAVIGLVASWASRPDVAIYHVVGMRDFEWARAHVPEVPDDGLWYRQVSYEQRMGLFYLASDVVVCRSGALTVAELAAMGLPALLVPLPHSPADHQGANARVLERAGACVVIDDEDCTAERLSTELGRLIDDPGLLETMRHRALGLGGKDAVGAVVALVERHARRRGDRPDPGPEATR